MITSYKYEGKNYEEILEKALKELEVTKNDIYLETQEEEGKLFKSKKYMIDIIKKQDVIDYIKSYIKEFAKNINMEINCEVREKDGNISVLLVSSNNSLLIGRDGKNLNALQLLLRNSLSTITNRKIMLMLDVSGYKNKKIKNLEFEIKKICKDVLRTKMEVKLDPMNSFERRIVHNVVGGYDNLKSNSVGEEPNRYTIISYKD